MMVCRRISTFSCSASAAALRSGRTLKPMMMAFDADASSTSDSLMAPTPERITRTFTLSLESFCSVSVSTSAEPPTSVLRMMGSSLTSPAAICLCNCSSVRRLILASAASRSFLVAENDDLLGLGGVGDHLEIVAGFGQRFEPSTSTGVEGSAFANLFAAIV
jgi:hypothetical protein